MGIKIIHEEGKYMDCTPLHGRWCNIDLVGQDVGYAQVGIISSGKNHILFQYLGRRGVVPKMYVKQIEEVRISRRRLEKQGELVVEPWDDSVDPYSLFIEKKCDIHVHQTRLFEASPGFFSAEILFVGQNTVRFKENSKEYTIRKNMICGMLECAEK